MFGWHWLGCGNNRHGENRSLQTRTHTRTKRICARQETVHFSHHDNKRRVCWNLCFRQVATKHAIHSLTHSQQYAVVCMMYCRVWGLPTVSLECGYQSINQSKQSRKLALPPILYKIIFIPAESSYFFLLVLWLDGLESITTVGVFICGR